MTPKLAILTRGPVTRPGPGGFAHSAYTLGEIIGVLTSLSGVLNPATVEEQWGLILNAFIERGMDTNVRIQASALATIRVECPPFRPIHEYGDTAYFTRMYEGRADLGNTHPGDGARFHGRGLLQLTGRANYRWYGDRIGVDLVANPDLALEPLIGAKVFALYWRTRGVDLAAGREDWPAVRRLVNGGYNGWEDFAHYLTLFGFPTSRARPR